MSFFVVKDRITTVYKPANALKSFNQYSGQMCFSSVTIAELMHGVKKGTYPDHNLRQVECFKSQLQVLDYGTNTTAHNSDVRASMERISKPIGVNSLQLDGSDQSKNLTLVTH